MFFKCEHFSELNIKNSIKIRRVLNHTSYVFNRTFLENSMKPKKPSWNWRKPAETSKNQPELKIENPKFHLRNGLTHQISAQKSNGNDRKGPIGLRVTIASIRAASSWSDSHPALHFTPAGSSCHTAFAARVLSHQMHSYINRRRIFSLPDSINSNQVRQQR
jgi:hypothetical protein